MSTEEQQVAFPVPPRWAPLVVEWDVDGTVRWCSASFAEQLGRTMDRVVGERWPELVPGEEAVCRRQQAFTVAALAEADLSVVDMPTRVGGRIEWFRWTEEAVRDDAGRLVAVRSTGVDITELYETKTELADVIHGLAEARALGRRDVLEQLHNGAAQQLAAARWAVSAGDRDDAVLLIEAALAAVQASMATLDPPVEFAVDPATSDEQFSRWTVEQGADASLPDRIRGPVVDVVSNSVAVLSSGGSVWLDADARFDLFGARRDVDLSALLAVMHPDDRAEVAAATVRALAGEETRVRWRFRHPERGWRQMTTWLTPLPVADGPRLAVALSMDITAEAGDPVRDVMDARLDERRRMAQELHDDVLQQLAGLRWMLAGGDGGDPLAELDALETAIRNRMRDTDGPVHRFGLEVALLHLLDHTATPVHLHVAGLEHVPVDVGAMLWRSAREALRNVDRHAGASSATVSVECDGRVVSLTVADDGGGVQDDRLHAAVRSGHLGVASMRESAAAAGGTFELRAGDDGGTVLRIELPLTSPGS